MPYVDRVTIIGPAGAAGWRDREPPPTPEADTPSRRAILTCRPAKAAEEAQCARQILSTLARRAYRRPVTDADVRAAARRSIDEGRDDADFEAGIEAALRRLLVSPEFLFRLERDPANVAARTPTTGSAISSWRRGCRSSSGAAFRTTTLLDLAAQGQARASRPCSSAGPPDAGGPRARRRSSSNFAGQWLQLRNLEAMRPDWALFPNFDDGVRVALPARDGALLREHSARGPRRSWSCSRPTTRSSTSGWRAITASRTCTATGSGA